MSPGNSTFTNEGVNIHIYIYIYIYIYKRRTHSPMCYYGEATRLITAHKTKTPSVNH
jgi:hypothetical protein